MYGGSLPAPGQRLPSGVVRLTPRSELVAGALLRAARGVQLLGAAVVLTGIRPGVARMLVEMQVDLGGLVTRSTLESGIAYGMSVR